MRVNKQRLALIQIEIYKLGLLHALPDTDEVYVSNKGSLRRRETD